MRYLSVYLVLLFCLLSVAQANDEALDYLNKIRRAAGMVEFGFNEHLQKAAQNHSNYLHYNREGGHGERRGSRFYTGSSHSDRIVAAGYASRQTGENVSYHTTPTTVQTSIDGLMSAIYHRFAFLSFKYDEAGAGQVVTPEYSAFTYNLGSKAKRALCQGESFRGPGRYVYSVCADDRFRVSPSAMDAANQVTRSQNEAMVVWPPKDGSDIPPAFYDEDPDPLPDHDVSGYPVSIQFNPAVYRGRFPQIERFELYRVKDNQRQHVIQVMNHQNDRNRKFKAFENALFPLRRLEWDTEYRAEVDYVEGGEVKTMNWTFRTRKLDVPLLTVTGDTLPMRMKLNETFAIYVPPRGPHDGRAAYGIRYSRGLQLDIKIYDSHTLLVTPKGAPGTATIDFHGYDIALVL